MLENQCLYAPSLAAALCLRFSEATCPNHQAKGLSLFFFPGHLHELDLSLPLFALCHQHLSGINAERAFGHAYTSPQLSWGGLSCCILPK